MKREKLIDNYMDFVVLLNFIAFFAIRNIPFFFWSVQVLFLICSLLYVRGKKVNFKYVQYALLFLLWTFLSFLWAESTDHVIKFLREAGQIAVICSALSFYCTDNEKILKAIRLMIIAMVAVAVYLMVRTPLEEWKNIYFFAGSSASSEGRLGYTIGMHPNEMGYVCAMACLLYFYYISLSRSNKMFGIIMLLVFIVLILFTKSRNSILFTGLSISLYWIFSKKNVNYKIIFRLLFVVAVVSVSVWAIFNIDFLYKIVGFRFAGLVGIIDSESKIDASTLLRQRLIEAGITIIKEHFLLGVGAGNYANMAYQSYGIWREVYSHSNIIEIFADLGVIGFLIYYLPRIYCVKVLYNKLKLVDTKYKKMYALLFAFCFSNVLFDYSIISYNKETVQFLFLLGFCAAFMIDSNKCIAGKNKVNWHSEGGDERINEE